MGIAARVIFPSFGVLFGRCLRVQHCPANSTPGKFTLYSIFCHAGIPQGSVFLGFVLFVDASGVCAQGLQYTGGASVSKCAHSLVRVKFLGSFNYAYHI